LKSLTCLVSFKPVFLHSVVGVAHQAWSDAVHLSGLVNWVNPNILQCPFRQEDCCFCI
jgi:hypothetical protein